MPPALLAAIAQALPVLAQGGAALGQQLRGKKLSKQQQPMYQIPSAIKELVATQRNQYNDPNIYARQLADNQIDSGVGQGIYSAKQAGGGSNEVLATIAALTGNANAAKNDLNIAGARQSRDMAPALTALGQAQNQQFDLNKLQPYLQSQQAAQDNFAAARMNFGNAVNNTSKLIGQLGARDALRSSSGQGGGTLTSEQMNKILEALKNI